MRADSLGNVFSSDASPPGISFMNGTRLAALVLIVAGVLGLVYGGFTYTKDTHETKLGPIELSVEEKQTVDIPVWLGACAIVAGVLLLVVRKKA
jgi:hypothetical protein